MLVKRTIAILSTLQQRAMSTSGSMTATAAAATTSAIPSSAETDTIVQKPASLPKAPISGLIGILKPSGCTSMSILDTLKPLLAQSKLFQVAGDQQLKKNKYKSNRKRRRDNDRFSDGGSVMAPKLGQGGTLDPLADGVLVLGIGAGTKKLQQFLDCTKEYKAVGLLGTSTLSYDSDDPILHRKPFDHVNADLIRNILPEFTGKFKQLPPLYSAIRIEGKRLFDYAREGKDLPRPIESRDVEITHMKLIDWKEAGQHEYKEPTKECDPVERKIAIRARRLAGLEEGEAEIQDQIDGEGKVVVEDQSEEKTEQASLNQQNLESESKPKLTDNDNTNGEKPLQPPTFTLQMSVSSGTYVRSIVHDVGVRAKSAAHVVRLSRTRQGDWISPEYQLKEGDNEIKLRKAIDWDILRRAAEELTEKSKRRKGEGGAAVENGTESDDQDEPATEADETLEYQISSWEQMLIDHMEVIST